MTTRAASDKCNAMDDDLDQIAAKIRAVSGTKETSEEERARRRQMYTAIRAGLICSECAKSLEPGEPVWRRRRSLGRGFFGGWRYEVATVCTDCKGHAWYGRTAPCNGCGRPVTNLHDIQRRLKHPFCCEKCRAKAYRISRRAKTAETREKECPVCGETFTAERSDAVTCSSACRQKAYRRRVASSEKRSHSG